MSSVLFLTRELPYPPNAGDRIVTYGFLRALAERGHEVHLLSYGRDADGPHADALRAVCASVARVPKPDPTLPTPVRKLVRAATGRSHVMAMFYSAEFRDAAADRIRSLTPDVAVAEHPYMGQCFLESPVRRAATDAGTGLVTNAHVVEYAAHRLHRNYADDYATRAELAVETPRLRRAELAVYEASDRTLVLGEEDRDELASRTSGPVACQRVALDVDSYATATTDDEAPNRLVFFGSYDWFPNEDAVLRLCERVFPEIREREPNAELVVAGRGATESVRALGARPGVEFVGEVDDLASLVRTAAVVVAPLRIGGGVRVKILESMAWGKPIVTTTRGFEGVAATPDEDLLVEDDWSEFAATVASLLGDEAERRRLADSARRTVEGTYAIPAVGAELERNLGLE